MTPASATSSPRIAAKRLDLPDPFAPTRPTLWRLCTVRSAASNRRRAPRDSVSRAILSMRAAAARSPEDVVVVDDQRRVIGEAAVLVDRRRARRRRDARRRDLVIDAPPDVLLPRRAAVRPPRVLVGSRDRRARNTSTKPSSSNTRVSHARSSGRNPEFFWLLRQLRRSIGWCAMFQSPHSTTSRPLCDERFEMRQECIEKAELRRLPMRAARPRLSPRTSTTSGAM